MKIGNLEIKWHNTHRYPLFWKHTLRKIIEGNKLTPMMSPAGEGEVPWKIACIKQARERFGWGLAESKMNVEIINHKYKIYEDEWYETYLITQEREK